MNTRAAGSDPPVDARVVDVRQRLTEEGPEFIRLLSRARSRLAARSRGLSEQIEELGQRIAFVRTKVDRLPRATGEDRRAVATELEQGWQALTRCAERVRQALDGDAEGA